MDCYLVDMHWLSDSEAFDVTQTNFQQHMLLIQRKRSFISWKTNLSNGKPNHF